MNNFQKLESNKIESLPDTTHDIKKRVDKSLDLYRFVGNIFDLYLPKVLGLMNNILGGDSINNKKTKYPNK